MAVLNGRRRSRSQFEGDFASAVQRMVRRLSAARVVLGRRGAKITDEPIVVAPCVESGRIAVVAAEITRGHFVNLCFAHYMQWETNRLRQIEMCLSWRTRQRMTWRTLSESPEKRDRCACPLPR